MDHYPIAIVPLPDQVTLSRFAEVSGYTRKALERKIERGVWLFGREYTKDPDGTLMVIVKGVSAWVGKGPASKFGTTASGSNSG